MDRLVWIAAWVSVCISGTVLKGAETASSRPNVVVLFADDQRADTIGALGNSHIKTPHLDRLAHRGMAFDRAYMQGGLQGATCVPSRAMLLTGRSLFRVDESLRREETWPAAFGRAGYSTFVTGKWHNHPDAIAQSFMFANSIFAGGMTNPLEAKLSQVVNGKLTKPVLAPKHACEVFADEAIAFIKSQKEGPFLAYVAFDAPHDPHIVPEDFAVKYDAKEILLPGNFLPQHRWDNGEMTVRDEQLLSWPRKPADVQQMNAEYYRYISYLDEQVGRILDAVEASPHAKNTIVVYAADSGVARGSHGLIGKQNVYEHSMRVPLLISGPGIAEGKRTNAMCYLLDLFPTLGEMCQVKGPSTSEGNSFQKVLSDPGQPGRDHVLLAYRDVQRAVRDDRYKLIRYPKIDRTQLFDLQSDPEEIHDLSGQQELETKKTQLLARLKEAQTEFGDKAALVVANPTPADWSPPK